MLPLALADLEGIITEAVPGEQFKMSTSFEQFLIRAPFKVFTSSSLF